MTGAEIRSLRQALGLTQTKFGRVIGRSKRSVIIYERGDLITDTTMLLLLKLIKFTVETADELFSSMLLGIDVPSQTIPPASDSE